MWAVGYVLWAVAVLTDAVADGRYNAPRPEGAAHTALIPQRLVWPGVVVIIVIAIFVTAALAGPLIRANMQEEISDSRSSDRPSR